MTAPPQQHGPAVPGGRRRHQDPGQQDAHRRGAEGGVRSVQAGHLRGHQHREAQCHRHQVCFKIVTFNGQRSC